MASPSLSPWSMFLALETTSSILVCFCLVSYLALAQLFEKIQKKDGFI